MFSIITGWINFTSLIIQNYSQNNFVVSKGDRNTDPSGQLCRFSVSFCVGLIVPPSVNYVFRSIVFLCLQLVVQKFVMTYHSAQSRIRAN